MKSLKYIRRGIAIFYGLVVGLFFLDFAELLPAQIHGLLHVQFVPALMAGSVIIIFSLLLLTLLFGRLYCSVLCPWGILQDAILRIKRWWMSWTKQKKKLRTKYEPPYNYLRYGILGAVTVSYAAGSAFLILLLDPYSNFGRITVSFFKPVVLYLNNAIAAIANRAGNYSFYNVTVEYQPGFMLLLSAIVLIVLVVLVWKKERIWCNTLCPVGTLLGLVSRYSLFRVHLNTEKCTHCKKCVSDCKSLCIDDVRGVVDSSRCVTCFNCLDKCKEGGVHYLPVGWAVRKGGDALPKTEESVRENKFNESRRRFITGSLLALAALPAGGKAAAAAGLATRRYPLPPGAGSLARFQQKCTACQLCVSKCPAHVLKPAFLENGISGLMQPHMYFSVHEFCQFECNLCTQICPNGALQKLSLEEKKLTQVGVVQFRKEECVVYFREEYCGACAEHCPTQAVHMVEYKNGLTIPAITPEICIGCGACESICPVRPDAIFIVGNDVQKRAEVPEIKQNDEEVVVDDFGF